MECYEAPTEAQAIVDGFTRRIELDGGPYTLDLLVHPQADLDGTFEAYDLDEGDFITVNGWLFVVTNEQVEG